MLKLEYCRLSGNVDSPRAAQLLSGLRGGAGGDAAGGLLSDADLELLGCNYDVYMGKIMEYQSAPYMTLA